jgi:hypothetical protein
VKARLESARVTSQALDNIGRLLRDDHRSLGEDDDREKDENADSDSTCGHLVLLDLDMFLDLDM